MKGRVVIVWAISCAGFLGSAQGQSFNIDFSSDGIAPSDSYAGAAEAGFWNAIHPVHGGPVIALSDRNGDPTGVTVRNIGGTSLVVMDAPGTLGDDGVLLDDYLVTYSTSLETCFFFNGIQNGLYEVIMFCWTPDNDETLSWATVDQSAAGGQAIGGRWIGQHVEGLTYSRHIAEVVNGSMQTHSAIMDGAPPAEGAAANGMQITLLSQCQGDIDGDGVVGSSDLAALIGTWGPCPGPAIPGSCLADMNGDWVVGSPDLAEMIGLWGACP